MVIASSATVASVTAIADGQGSPCRPEGRGPGSPTQLIAGLGNGVGNGVGDDANGGGGVADTVRAGLGNSAGLGEGDDANVCGGVADAIGAGLAHPAIAPISNRTARCRIRCADSLARST